jgi:hypothetical protein
VSLVSLVVLGTAVTVFRYMESSGHPRTEVRAQGTVQTIGSRLEVRGNCDKARARSLGTAQDGGGYSRTTESTAGGCGSTVAPAEPTSSAPSAYDPE